MSYEPSHIIHKQVVEISTKNARQARSIEKNFTGLLREITNDKIEKCFDDLLPPNQHLVIEKLEINLGVFTNDALYKEIGPRLSVALKEALSQVKSQTGEPADSLRMNGDINNPLQTFPDKKKSASRIDGQFEIFIFYLEKGRLPAWATAKPALEGDWIKKLAPAQQVILKEALLRSTQSLLRLATHFSPGFIINILQHYVHENLFFDNLYWLSDHLKDFSFYTSIRKYYWANAILSILRSGENAEIKKELTDEIVYEIIHNIPSNLSTEFILSIKQLVKEEDIPQLLKTSFQRIIAKENNANNKFHFNEYDEELLPPIKNWQELESPENINLIPGEKGQNSSAADDLNEVVSAGLLKDETLNSLNKEILNNEEEIFIDDAGLVILHPFINELFQSGDLLDEGKFKSLESAARAVNLLEYLAHHTEDLPEYRKLLPKLLCGIAWEIVLPEILPLTAQEKENAHQLLMAVVTHWKALKSTSAAALQETFIRRGGKIFKTKKGIELEVEGKTEDILLSRLPWGFSMIKLKWMPAILYVKWN